MEAGLRGKTRRSSRERVMTRKTRELATSQQRQENNREESESDSNIEVAPVTPAAPRRGRQQIVHSVVGHQGDTERSTEDTQMNKLLNMVAVLLKSHKEQKQEQDAFKEEIITKLNGTTEKMNRLAERIDKMAEVMGEMPATINELTKRIEELEIQLTGLQTPSNEKPSYADVAGAPHTNQQSNVRTLPTGTVPRTSADTFYCTIDMSQASEESRKRNTPSMIRKTIEQTIRTEGKENWRCLAVTRDLRNTERIRITCKDELELRHVKEAAKTIAVDGTRLLRDQLYPVRVDNACRLGVLNEQGEVHPEATKRLGEENEIRIAKINWLSRKDNGKAYGSMVVYLNNGSDAMKMLQRQYFDVNGESAYTKTFNPSARPTQCYKCQQLGHKAFACSKPQTCAKCACEGHHHRDCHEVVLKCVPCGGPHESFSKNCLKLFPRNG